MNDPLAKLSICAVGFMASACSLFPSAPEAQSINHYLADPLDLDSVRRVMVLPFDESPGVSSQEAMVRNMFIMEMGKLQSFEVVPLPEQAKEYQEIHRSLRRGNISVGALAKLSERYGIDGVILGTITSYRAYKPASLGMRVQLISMHSGKAVWAAEGMFDCGDAMVLEDLQHYAKSFAAAEDSLHGWEIHMLSPRKFAAYVCHRIAGSVKDAALRR